MEIKTSSSAAPRLSALLQMTLLGTEASLTMTSWVMMTTHTDMQANSPVSTHWDTCTRTHTRAQRQPRDALSVLLTMAD